MMVTSISSHFVGPFGGLVMSLIAFSIVFIIITGLMFLMMALKHFCKAIESVGGSGSKEAAPAASKPTTPAAKAVAVTTEDSAELLAVISAAISAMCGSTARVVSFAPAGTKTPAATGWKFVGRMQNVEGFQD